MKQMNCPICGRKAWVTHELVDGFDFGWDAGCPVFKLDDGIHGITDETPKEKWLCVQGLASRKEAISAWNERVKKILDEVKA